MPAAMARVWRNSLILFFFCHVGLPIRASKGPTRAKNVRLASWRCLSWDTWVLHAKKAGSRKGIRGKAQLKVAVGDKNDLKKLHWRRYGGYFHTSLHNRSTRNIFLLALSRRSIYEAAKGFQHARVNLSSACAVSLRLCTATQRPPRSPHTNGLMQHEFSSSPPIYAIIPPAPQGSRATFTNIHASVCTNGILARDPFIKMPNAHFRAADLNFNLFCYEANLLGCNAINIWLIFDRESFWFFSPTIRHLQTRPEHFQLPNIDEFV